MLNFQNGQKHTNNFEGHLGKKKFCQVWFYVFEKKMEMRKFIDTKLNGNTSHCPFGSGELKRQ